MAITIEDVRRVETGLDKIAAMRRLSDLDHWAFSMGREGQEAMFVARLPTDRERMNGYRVKVVEVRDRPARRKWPRKEDEEATDWWLKGESDG